MDADLMRYAGMGRKAGVLLLLGIIPAFAVGETLVDPTRPPAELASHPGGAAESNGLQSVIISPTRRAAIIYGQTVELGEKVGDVRLIEVNEGGVVLQGAKGLEVLTLFPNVKINRKALVVPLEHEANHSVRQAGAAKLSGQAGEKEE